MKNYEFKNILLNELKENGRMKIEDCIYYSASRTENIYLIFDKKGQLLIKFDILEYDDNVLYDFGNKEDFRNEFEPIHKEFLKNGKTEIKDFSDFIDWYFEENFIEEKVENIRGIIKRKINEILDNYNEVDEIFNNIKKKIRLIAEEVTKESYEEVNIKLGNDLDYCPHIDLYNRLVEIAYNEIIPYYLEF